MCRFSDARHLRNKGQRGAGDRRLKLIRTSAFNQRKLLDFDWNIRPCNIVDFFAPQGLTNLRIVSTSAGIQDVAQKVCFWKTYGKYADVLCGSGYWRYSLCRNTRGGDVWSRSALWLCWPSLGKCLNVDLDLWRLTISGIFPQREVKDIKRENYGLDYLSDLVCQTEND